MDQRQRAIRVLERAQTILANRLAQRVLAESEDIVEDAQGLSFMDEIRALYDQLGGRLEKVNQMLDDLRQAQRTPAPRSVPRLTARGASTSGLVPVTLNTYARQIQENRLEVAEQFLVTLLDIDPALARRCTEHFANRLRQNPATLVQLQQLQSEAEGGRLREVGRLLGICFGLDSSQALTMMKNLRYRFGPASK